MASISAPSSQCPAAVGFAGVRSGIPSSVASGGFLSAREAKVKRFPILRAQAQEISIKDSSGSKDSTNLEVLSKNGSFSDVPTQSHSQVTMSDSEISAFVSEVSRLVMLVDSKDVAEVQLKSNDCEVIIRKKEALQQNLPVGPPVTAVYPQTMHPPQPPMVQTVSPNVPASPASATTNGAPALPPPKSGNKSIPALKSPMAGTFYRCPGPGEPPFVKVGDKVKKGQVVCIIEAMKLMNEIEADQSGTIVDIVAEDGKPVSVDAPLIVIQP